VRDASEHDPACWGRRQSPTFTSLRLEFTNISCFTLCIAAPPRCFGSIDFSVSRERSLAGGLLLGISGAMAAACNIDETPSVPEAARAILAASANNEALTDGGSSDALAAGLRQSGPPPFEPHQDREEEDNGYVVVDRDGAERVQIQTATRSIGVVAKPKLVPPGPPQHPVPAHPLRCS